MSYFESQKYFPQESEEWKIVLRHQIPLNVTATFSDLAHPSPGFDDAYSNFIGTCGELKVTDYSEDLKIVNCWRFASL